MLLLCCRLGAWNAPSGSPVSLGESGRVLLGCLSVVAAGGSLGAGSCSLAPLPELLRAPFLLPRDLQGGRGPGARSHGQHPGRSWHEAPGAAPPAQPRGRRAGLVRSRRQSPAPTA